MYKRQSVSSSFLISIRKILFSVIKDYKNNVLKSGSIIVYGVHIKISIKIEDVCIDVMKTGIIGVYKRFSNTYPPLF